MQQRNMELAVSAQVEVLQGEAQQCQFPVHGISCIYRKPLHLKLTIAANINTQKLLFSINSY
jgi:acyl-CoA thioesterase FadM